jgi:glycosyltransferase involved in cell wall biosynthesis
MPRLLRTYSNLSHAYRAVQEPDAVLVGALGHLDLLWLRCLPGADRIPVVFDPFVSLYDTVIGDRKLLRSGGIGAGACRSLDLEACVRADRVLVDTGVMARRFAASFDLPAERLVRIFQGQDDRVFRPLDGIRPGSAAGAPIEVLYAGTYVPLHGVDTILEAAARLRGRAVRFTLVGDGQEGERMRTRAGRLALDNVRFVTEWQPAHALAERMHRADVCLGIFGAGEKAASVIPLKAVAALAVGRALITRSSEAARELLRHGENAWLVPPRDPEALASAIVALESRERRESIGRAGRRLFLDRLSPRALGRELKTLLTDLVEDRTRTLATV